MIVIDLLRFEADFKTIQVIYNSIGNRDLNTAAKIITTRKNLCPTIGYFFYTNIHKSKFIYMK